MQEEGFKDLDPVPEQVETDRLLAFIVDKGIYDLHCFLFTFIHRTEDSTLIQSVARLLPMLVGDPPISAIVPFQFHNHFIETCHLVLDSKGVSTNLQQIKEYGTHLSNTLKISIDCGFGSTCANFYKYLLHEVTRVHSNDAAVLPHNEALRAYNPEEGIAYYFTEHGGQIHRQPEFAVQQVSKTYDDEPIADAKCCKKFCSASYGGYSYIFLWFCPFMDTHMGST